MMSGNFLSTLHGHFLELLVLASVMVDEILNSTRMVIKSNNGIIFCKKKFDLNFECRKLSVLYLEDAALIIDLR